MKYTLIIPTLNEIDGVREIMPKIRGEWYDQLIIADGNSTDGTIEYLREKGYPVYLQKKKGMRNAYMEIYDLIEGDIIMTFSPNGNSLPDLIPQLLRGAYYSLHYPL
jgi:glycosyltransferase involved in cell wall biosynthesis